MKYIDNSQVKLLARNPDKVTKVLSTLFDADTLKTHQENVVVVAGGVMVIQRDKGIPIHTYIGILQRRAHAVCTAAHQSSLTPHSCVRCSADYQY